MWRGAATVPGEVGSCNRGRATSSSVTQNNKPPPRYRNNRHEISSQLFPLIHIYWELTFKCAWGINHQNQKDSLKNNESRRMKQHHIT